MYGYVGSRDTARELVQDLFLSVWDNVAGSGAPMPAAPYLYTAARNRALRSLRHGKVEARYSASQYSADVPDRPLERADSYGRERIESHRALASVA